MPPMSEGTSEFSRAIALCLLGLISPPVAVARLLLAGATTRDIRAEVAAQRPTPTTPRWEALVCLLEGRTTALDDLAAEIAQVGGDHSAFMAGDCITRVAAFFDRQVARSPEASVALFSLGDPAILADATREIVDWLVAAGLLDGLPDVLDLGCGIGRIAMAIAPRCQSVLGLDVSAGMVEEARRRHTKQDHVRFEKTSGRDLTALPTNRFDLVLAVDSFPYIIQAGEDVVEAHIAGAARVLRPSGTLALLNLSYREDPAVDHIDAARWAARYGFRISLAEDHSFRLWDGDAFLLRRPPLEPSLTTIVSKQAS